MTLISQVLYEVAEISSAKQIEGLLPSGLDSRLQQLISTVRSVESLYGQEAEYVE